MNTEITWMMFLICSVIQSSYNKSSTGTVLVFCKISGWTLTWCTFTKAIMWSYPFQPCYLDTYSCKGQCIVHMLLVEVLFYWFISIIPNWCKNKQPYVCVNFIFLLLPMLLVFSKKNTNVCSATMYSPNWSGAVRVSRPAPIKDKKNTADRAIQTYLNAGTYPLCWANAL